MKSAPLAIIWATGIAIFSMFFGSGNVVFPLQLGQNTGSMIGFAVGGLLLTAIGAPLLGLLGAVLFEGDCKKFFYRMGTIPGYLAVVLIIGLIGPFGVMPRCFVVAYGAITPYFPDLSLMLFSLIAGFITLLFVLNHKLILPILGYVLSPLLVVSLIVIIIVGLITTGHPIATTSDLTANAAFFQGIMTGYDTMDLLASIFFAVSIWLMLKDQLKLKSDDEIKTRLIPTYLYSSLIGGVLLGLMYIGLCFVTARHAALLQGVAPQELLSNLSIQLLGNKLSIVANFAIAIACLTTIMALAVTTADVIHVELDGSKLASKINYRYSWMVCFIVVISVILSNLGFMKIMIFLHTVMVVCYPAIIVLTLCNILHKLYNFPYVKIPVYTTFLATLAYNFLA